MLDGRVLNELLDRDPRAAWDLLVEECSDLILGVIARYTRDSDRRMDAYLYVLEQLKAQDFRRLRHYGEGVGFRPCTFATWLKLVVRNLYFDWFRHEHGRKSLPKEIQKMGRIEQRAFKLLYWEGYSAQEAFEVLRGENSSLRFGEFVQKLARVEERLSPINRAKIRRDFDRARRPLSLDDDKEGPPLEARAEVRTPTPEDETAVAERGQALWNLIAELPAEDRLLVRLRFFEGLTAKQIAAATGMLEPPEIYRRTRGVELVLREGDPAELADLTDIGRDPHGAP
jgi:RNA polymerase sigma factor (sigma-70 family)